MKENNHSVQLSEERQEQVPMEENIYPDLLWLYTLGSLIDAPLLINVWKIFSPPSQLFNFPVY